MGETADPSAALEAILHRFRAMVVSVASRHALRDNDLDALVQEIRIRLWRSQSTSEEIGALPTSYIYQTAMSAAIDLVRKRRRSDARYPEREDEQMQLAVAAWSGGL
jgi:RNA polymerase sigma factor (sigma-70 family)